MKAISIRQPWAWLIVNGYKDIENRNWKTNYRGRVLIHAGQTQDHEMAHLMQMWAMGANDSTGFLSPKSRPDLMELAKRYCADLELSVGGIVGAADIMDCVDRSDSPWFKGKYGFVLKNAEKLPFQLMRGKLGLFEVAA